MEIQRARAAEARAMGLEDHWLNPVGYGMDDSQESFDRLAMSDHSAPHDDIDDLRVRESGFREFYDDTETLRALEEKEKIRTAKSSRMLPTAALMPNHVRTPSYQTTLALTITTLRPATTRLVSTIRKQCQRSLQPSR